MGKRVVIATSLTLEVIISLFVIVPYVIANFYMPPNNPQITIDYPLPGGIYRSTELTLNFTYVHNLYTPTAYKLDANNFTEVQTKTISKGPLPPEYQNSSNVPLYRYTDKGTVILSNLTEGTHSVTVYAFVTYTGQPDPVIEASDTVSFIVDTQNLYPDVEQTPIPASTPITSFYEGGHGGPTSYVNYGSFYITIYSPNDQITYVNTMALKFNITWTTYPIFPFPQFPPALNGYYAYSIDNGPFVQVASNQSANDVFYQRPLNNFTINPSFSYLVDISNLEKGYHQIIINASLYTSTVLPTEGLYFNMTTSPYTFLAGEPTLTPSPTIALPTPIASILATPSPNPTFPPSPSPPLTPALTPAASSTPSLSPTQQPTTELTPNDTGVTPLRILTPFPVYVGAAAIVVVIIVVVGLLVYFRNRRKV